MILNEKGRFDSVIDHGLSLGADFAEVYVERTQRQSINFSSQSVKGIQSGIDYGLGIRLFYGTQILYGYTNSDDLDELKKLTSMIAGQWKKERNPQKVDHTQISAVRQVASYAIPKTPLEKKLELIRRLDNEVRGESDKIIQVKVDLHLLEKEVAIHNSDGNFAHEMRPYTRFTTMALGKDGHQEAQGVWSPGARGGWGYVEKMDLQEIASKVVSQSLTLLKAAPCPVGKMPVVIDNGFGGVIFHEACGHLLETTSVEKKASVFWDKKGEMIAHPCLTAIDDGTMDNLWGSLTYDDEGMPTQNTVLIKEGKLENFMADLMGHLKTGHPRTGSGRRQDYKFAPASRMRNTFIAPGPHSKEEVISTIENGLYCASMGGGSVNPGTGEFNFSVQEGYLIEKGKVTQPIKGGTLIGRGEEIMTKISMVADNIDYAAGVCGSVSGMIPATVGQPAVKVDEILVGGKA